MNILIMSASRDVSLIRTLKKAFEKEGLGKIVAVDNSLYSAALFEAEYFSYIPRDTDPNFLEELIKVCQKFQVKMIIPSRDEELTFFSKNISKLKDKGINVLVASEKTIEICRDKLGFFNFCRANGFNVPEIYTQEEVKDGRVKFPLFLNGRFSKGSKSAFKVNNQEQLELHLKEEKEMIIEEYVDAKEYSIDLFADIQGNIFSVVPRERINTFGGESFVGKTFKNETIITDSINLSKKLGLIGWNTLQCFFDGTKTKFIEVNARYGGGIDLGLAADPNAAASFAKILKGEKVASQIGEFKDNLVMIRYTQDFFIEEEKLNWQEKNLREKKYDSA
jgi:carbamoyl-phosphate synthase large subunit